MFDPSGGGIIGRVIVAVTVELNARQALKPDYIRIPASISEIGNPTALPREPACRPGAVRHIHPVLTVVVWTILPPGSERRRSEPPQPRSALSQTAAPDARDRRTLIAAVSSTSFRCAA